MMNSPFCVAQARHVLERRDISAEEDVASRIAGLYRLLFQRSPDADEVTLGSSFIANEEQAGHDAVAWQYGYGEYDDATQRVKTFTPFTHFVAGTWQMDKKLPDGKTGFASLTATGGHPGNSLQFAVIRRWTSPIDGIVKISGTLSHQEKVGDGVHGRIVVAGRGELASWNVFQSEAETSLENVLLKKGDTVDFIVDCRTGPTCDSFNWSPTVRVATAPAVAGTDGPEEWNASSNFGGPEKACPVALRVGEVRASAAGIERICFPGLKDSCQLPSAILIRSPQPSARRCPTFRSTNGSR